MGGRGAAAAEPAIGSLARGTGFLGIDFSGGAAAWTAGCRRPTVWIARIAETDRLTLAELRPVQALPGNGQPYERLAMLLAHGSYAAAAIDAPFSLPCAHLPSGGHAELLEAVLALPCAADRPFARAGAIVGLGLQVGAKASAKPFRAAERYWLSQGVNTRSTMWDGPRGGAAFAAASLRLLALARRPIWPWQQADAGLIVEAFPAAQLRQWALPHQGYSRPGDAHVRERIVDAIAGALAVSADFKATMIEVPDALDAVIAAFAAVAVVGGDYVAAPYDTTDGHIVVKSSLPKSSFPNLPT